MKSQINLYRAIPDLPQYFLTLLLMRQIVIGFVILLFCISLLQHVELDHQRQHLAFLQLQSVTTAHQLLAVSQEEAVLSLNHQSLAALRQELAAKQSLYALLSTQSAPGSCAVFSDYLASLAQKTVMGVWLTNIDVELESNTVLLSGTAVYPSLVMQFIQSLANTKCFADRPFNSIKVTNLAKQAATNRVPGQIMANQSATGATSAVPPSVMSVPAAPSGLNFIISSTIATSVAPVPQTGGH